MAYRNPSPWYLHSTSDMRDNWNQATHVEGRSSACHLGPGGTAPCHSTPGQKLKQRNLSKRLTMRKEATTNAEKDVGEGNI